MKTYEKLSIVVYTLENCDVVTASEFAEPDEKENFIEVGRTWGK